MVHIIDANAVGPKGKSVSQTQKKSPHLAALQEVNKCMK